MASISYHFHNVVPSLHNGLLPCRCTSSSTVAGQTCDTKRRHNSIDRKHHKAAQVKSPVHIFEEHHHAISFSTSWSNLKDGRFWLITSPPPLKRVIGLLRDKKIKLTVSLTFAIEVLRNYATRSVQSKPWIHLICRRLTT